MVAYTVEDAPIGRSKLQSVGIRTPYVLGVNVSGNFPPKASRRDDMLKTLSDTSCMIL